MIGELLEVDAHDESLEFVDAAVVAVDFALGGGAEDGLEEVVDLVAVADVGTGNGVPFLHLLHLQPLYDLLRHP